jgi:hypothetical protein
MYCGGGEEEKKRIKGRRGRRERERERAKGNKGERLVFFIF